jgi:hypothetical protein
MTNNQINPYSQFLGNSGLMNFSPNIALANNDFYGGVGALYTNTNISPHPAHNMFHFGGGNGNVHSQTPGSAKIGDLINVQQPLITNNIFG